MATTLATLRQRTLESIGDYLSVKLTTAIAASKLVISTNLNEYDGGSDDYFNGWYVYITDYNNIGVERQIADYATSGGQITVRGANLTVETNPTDYATVWVCRHSVLQTIDKAINRAREEVFPALHKRIDDITLITGNELPDASFEWWTSSSALQFYSATNATLGQTKWSAANAPYIRGQRGTTSMLVTANAADGYAYISSYTYPRLLDLMGRTIDFQCWARPSTANDAFLTIYTIKADGTTTQTLDSTTTCPITKWTLLELEDQSINDDIVEIQFWFRVHTNTETCYFDDAIVCGRNLYEYLIPTTLQSGYVNQVYSQTTGYSDDIAYDLQPTDWQSELFSIIDDGTYRYLHLTDLLETYRRLRLLGIAPLDSLSAATDTINISEGGKTDLLIAYAGYLLYEIAESPVSSEDVARYEREKAKRYNKYLMLLRKHRMLGPAGRLRV